MLLLFSLTAFLGAFLLFCVQPMIAKMVLPQFGGAPAVWTTCMVFFQAALFAGYAYADALCRWVRPRRQALVHLAFLGLAMVALPIAGPAAHASSGSPALRLLGGLVLAVGLPFFVVSTTAPLLQRWFAETGHRRSADPYFVYAASNSGSLVALVGYVTLIEPNLTLSLQSRLWAAGYALLAALLVACGVVVVRAAVPISEAAKAEPIALSERLRWVALAFAPSSLLLGVTTYLTTDLAPVPLLWVVPLVLYLLSFIIAFANPPDGVRRGCALVLPLAIVATLALLVQPKAVSLRGTFAIHLLTFFVAATACHTELARRRPLAGRLTEYYLLIALGGGLGGLFNALVSPAIFTWVAEYPLALALAALLVPAGTALAVLRSRNSRLARVFDVVLPLLLGGIVYGTPYLLGERPPARLLLVPLGVCLLFIRRPVRFAIALAVVAAVLADYRDATWNVVLRERSFFGVLKVTANYPKGMNSLVHGNTVHGMQRRSPLVAERRIPLMYYFPTGPIGQVFESYQGTPVVERVGVVGLGVGSLAGYGKRGQNMTFFEVDPAVDRIARDRTYFHYLDDCRAAWSVVLGDARLTLAHEPDSSFGLIVLDAFSGDAIPVHLLTREALAIYLAKLGEGGLIAFHISNNSVDLEPAIRELARDAGLAGLGLNETTVPLNELAQGRMVSHWVVLARRRSDLDRLAARPGWRPLEDRPKTPVWTDSYSDLFSLLRWF